jgi:hypothetical protein
MAIDVMWDLLLISFWSSGDLRWLVTYSKYFATRFYIQFPYFFPHNNVICFVVCNQTFAASSAQGQNVMATHVIVMDDASLMIWLELKPMDWLLFSMKNAHVS